MVEDNASVTVDDSAYLYEIGEAPDWTGASCASVDPKLWFPGPHGQGAHMAKQICSACPLRKACLDFANANDVQDGIWGGLDYVHRLDVKYGRAEYDGTVERVRLPA